MLFFNQIDNTWKNSLIIYHIKPWHNLQHRTILKCLKCLCVLVQIKPVIADLNDSRADSVWFSMWLSLIRWICSLWPEFVWFGSDFRCFSVGFWFSRCFHHNTRPKWRWCHNQPLPWQRALWPHTGWLARCSVGGVVHDTSTHGFTDRV